MIGRSLGHFRILARLGAGGMGEVYRAKDTRLEREVAIKLVGPRVTADPTLRDRLLLEAKTASALNHPHICTIYEVGAAEGHTFIAMEYIAGETLSRMIPAGGLPVELVLRYGSQIADAIDHAHELGIVHRDLKSSNVVIASGGRAKVLDFGLAKQINEKELDSLTRTTLPFSQPGAIVGTLQYLAPEILRGQPADTRGDIWSLGVILYELASGELPFQGKSGYEISASIQMATPAALPTHVPPGLRAVIQRCLSKDPSQRYHRAGEIRAALEALSSGSDLRPEILVAPRRRSWPIVLTLVVTAAALGLGYLSLRERPISPEAPLTRMTLLVSSAGSLSDPVLSADASTMAYVAEEDGRPDIFVRRVEGGKAIRLTDDPGLEQELDFSHRGDRLAFARVRAGQSIEICVIPTLGGDVVPVVTDANVPSWSPDDRQLAFFRRSPAGEAVELVTFAFDGGEVRVLLENDAELPFFTDVDWSPRGDHLAVIRGRGGIQRELWIVPLDGSPAHRLGEDSAEIFLDDAVFTADGEAVVYSSNRAGATNLWRQRLDGSAPQRLTSGTGPDSCPSIASTGAMVFLNARTRTGLILFDLQTGVARSILSHNRYLWAPVFSPDGQEIAYSRGEIDGSWHIWTVSSSGEGNRQVSTGEIPQILPRYTPDGRSILYFTWSAKKDRIWSIAREGGTARPLTPDSEYDESYQDISPDGRWLVFTRTLPSGAFVHVMPIDGGEPRQLTTTSSEVPRWSPDGQWIAFSPNRGSDSGAWIVRPDGRDLQRLTDTGGWPTWWPDSKSVVYLVDNEEGRQEFWRVPIEGGSPEQIGPPSVTPNNPVGISPDGRSLTYSEDLGVSSEIWMLETASTP